MNNIILTSLISLVAAEEPSIGFVAGFLIPMIVVLILVLLNGLFVAAEFALLGTRASQMEILAEEGNKQAGTVMEVLEDSNKQNSFLATAQLGITVVTLALSMYGERSIAEYLNPYFHNWFPSLSEPVIVALETILVLGFLTYLHVVFGEMIPKSLALTSPSKTVLQLFRPMYLLQTILNLPIRFLNWLGDSLLRIFRVEPAHGHARLYSSEEIELIVSESSEEGLISDDAEEMISNIFDFRDREVSHVMTPRRKIDGIPVSIAYNDLLKIVTESRHSRFPVYEGDLDHIVGLLHLKDLVRHHENGKEEFNLRNLLRPTPIVPEDHRVEDLLSAFKLQRIHMAVVLDEYGGVAGIVTLEDLVEEVVGEVRDEFDIEKEPVVKVAPGEFELTGDYLLDDLQEDVFLGEEDTLPDVDTVGGLIVTLLGRPAVVDDRIALDNNVAFQVMAVEGRAVTRARVTFPVPENEKKQPPAEDEADEH